MIIGFNETHLQIKKSVLAIMGKNRFDQLFHNTYKRGFMVSPKPRILPETVIVSGSILLPRKRLIRDTFFQSFCKHLILYSFYKEMMVDFTRGCVKL